MKKGQIRQTELKRKRSRKEKAKKLRAKYALLRSKAEKEKIIEKALRVNPHLTRQQFLMGLAGQAGRKKA